MVKRMVPCLRHSEQLDISNENSRKPASENVGLPLRAHSSLGYDGTHRPQADAQLYPMQFSRRASKLLSGWCAAVMGGATWVLTSQVAPNFFEGPSHESGWYVLLLTIVLTALVWGIVFFGLRTFLAKMAAGE